MLLSASSIETPTIDYGKTTLISRGNLPIIEPMKDLRVEITDEASALYIAVDPDGQWAKTTQPDDLITIDWDRQGRVIGIEAIGSVARQAIYALLQVVADYPARDREGLQEALDGLTRSTARARRAN